MQPGTDAAFVAQMEQVLDVYSSMRVFRQKTPRQYGIDLN